MALNVTLTTQIGLNTTETILTRPPITPSPVQIHIEACLVSESDESHVITAILVYGCLFTCYMMLKGIRTFRRYNTQNDDDEQKRFGGRIGLFLIDFVQKKRSIYFLIFLHIWNQATDIGVVVEMYYLSFTSCTIGYTLLYRLFALGIAFMLFYRMVTAILAIYATQRPHHFVYQFLDLLLIQNLELSYIFESESMDEVQTWIIWSGCCLQSFGIMLITAGVMTLTQGYYEHPVLLLSFVVSFIFCTYCLILHDRILYNPFARTLQFDRSQLLSVECTCTRKEVLSGYCCYCNGFRLEYVYRVLFRCFDFQIRVFLLTFIWTGIGGAYLALYLFIEFLVLYSKARKFGRYQLLSGLLGIVINHTSPDATRFCHAFTIYRFSANVILLAVIFVCVNVPATDAIPISDPYELRRSDFVDQSNIMMLFWYLCAIALIQPWLYFGALRRGRLIRTDQDAATNVRDPHCIIANKDFATFIHLIVFGNIFYHGNEWVLQGLLDALKDDIFRILPKYWILLLRSYAWDFTKISYYSKAKFFASIMRFNERELSKLLFDQMIACGDVKGVEAGLLYWCQTRNFNENNSAFIQIIKLIQSKFVLNTLHVLVQSKLLKYTILRAATLGDLEPFHCMLAYRLAPETLSHTYLHYTDFVANETAWNADIFADILHSIFHVKHFIFNVDNVTAKCFLYWALKFELWETVHELLKHKHHSKQVYSTYHNDEPFLHLVCKIPCDYERDREISSNLCAITDTCINDLYVPLNEGNKSKVTTLMYACYVLHIPLIETILKYGPSVDATDANEKDYEWYIEHNYWIENNKISNDAALPTATVTTTAGEAEEEKHGAAAAALIDVSEIADVVEIKISRNEMNKRKILALQLLSRSIDDITEEEDDFIESYEERYDEFIVSDRLLHIYKSTKYDMNVLFEAIVVQDFQRIIDLIDNHTFDANMPTIDGTTPLHFACEHSGALVIKFLMDRGAFPFQIQNNLVFPIHMLEQNKIADEEEKKFMLRLLDVRDVDHDPFAMTDARVVEVGRIQSFATIFLRYLLILFAIWFCTFATSVGLTDKFRFGYIPPL